jgi:flagellar hook-length control protein FliK
LTVRNGMMTARIEAESSTARNLLLDNLPALRDRLAEQDIKVQRFDVDLGPRSSGGSPQEPGDHHHPQDRPQHGTHHAGGGQENPADNPTAAGGAQHLGEKSQFDVTI